MLPRTCSMSTTPKNVGLIKREFLLLADGEPYLVTSSLKSISCPLAQ